MFKWRSGADHPKKSGDYLCLVIGCYFQSLTYTVENGWNTSSDNSDSKFPDSDITAWIEQAVLKDMLNKQFGEKKEEMA